MFKSRTHLLVLLSLIAGVSLWATFSTQLSCNRSSNISSQVSSNPAYYVEQAEALYKRGDRTGAYACWNKAIKLDRAYGLCSRASVIWRDDSLAQANLRDIEEVLTINPRNAEAYNIRSHLRANQWHFEDALADANMAMALNPASPFFINTRAFMKCHLKKYREAVAGFTESLTIKSDPVTLCARANSYRLLKQLDKAEQDYTSAILLNPAFQYAYEERSKLRVCRNDYIGALLDQWAAKTIRS